MTINRSYRYVLLDAIRSTVGHPAWGVEIGVWAGECSRALLDSFPALNLLMIDPWRDTEDATYSGLDHTGAFRRAVATTAFAADRRILWRATSLEAAALIGARAEGHFDFIFLDGSHLYDSVVADIAAWWPMIRPGGVLAGHDYENHRWGVKRAVNEWSLATGQNILIGQGRVWWTVKPE